MRIRRLLALVACAAASVPVGAFAGTLFGATWTQTIQGVSRGACFVVAATRPAGRG